MATSIHCDLCGNIIPSNQKSKALEVFVSPMAERNPSEAMVFARDNWSVDVCLSCAKKLAPYLGIDPLMKGDG